MSIAKGLEAGVIDAENVIVIVVRKGARVKEGWDAGGAVQAG